MRSKLTTLIFIGMILGIVVGYMCNIMWPDPQTAKTIAGYISLLTDLFLRMIKMIIAPLVFTTLVVGIAHMGDTAAIGSRRTPTAGSWMTMSLRPALFSTTKWMRSQ